MTFTAEAIKSGHTPEARAKAVATMKRLGVGIFAKRTKKKAKATKLHRSPEERAKIVARVEALLARGLPIYKACEQVGIYRTMFTKWKSQPRLLKGNGRTDTIDISSLPSRPSARRKKGTRLLRTPLVKAQLVAKIGALVAKGMTAKAACTQVGLHDTQYRAWKRDRSLKAAINGYTHHAAPNGSAVRLVLQLNGEDHTVSLQEAMSLREGLDALLGARTAVD